MSQYNKLSNIQYARFQILSVDLYFGLFWSAGIPTMRWLTRNYSILYHTVTQGPVACRCISAYLAIDRRKGSLVYDREE